MVTDSFRVSISTSSSKFASQLTFEFTMGCVPTFLDGDCVVSPLEAARLGVCRIPIFPG